MLRVYLLLRNNKQEGPFSLEELLLKKLKPHDLVWVEGQSAGWRYPNEVDELRPYLDPVEIPNDGIAEKQTPKIKTTNNGSNKKVFVALPFGKSETQSQAFAEKKETGAKDEIEIKYSRSLDDIKNEYAAWLKMQQSTGRKWRRFRPLLFPTFILLTVCIAATLVAFNNEKPGNEGTLSSIDPMSSSGETRNSLSGKKSPKTFVTKSRKPTAVLLKSKQNSIRSSVVKSAKKKKIAKGTTSKKSESQTVPLSKLVSISGTYRPGDKQGISDFRITVKNNSYESFRFVAVDVLYLSADGHETARKTIYFNHISAHGSLTLTAPTNTKANDVRLQLGLLSSENGEVYYAMQ
jgi:hypothetical protein